MNGTEIGSNHYPSVVLDLDMVPYDCLCGWVHDAAAGGWVIRTYDGACPRAVPAVSAPV